VNVKAPPPITGSLKNFLWRPGSFALCVGLACSKPTGGSPAPTSVSARAVASAASHVVAAEEQSSASAFALVARPNGLHLIWASAAPGPDWLYEAELGNSGERRYAARPLKVAAHTLGKVTDLAATSWGGQLALAWLEQGASEARAQASVYDADKAPAVLDLGPAALVAEAARGNIAIAPEPERGRALVLWRGLEAPCVNAQTGPCTGFTFRRIGNGVADATGLPLSVPVPCASHSVQLATAAGRFHYGVCTREGADPLTTMFSIQYDPEYARAEPLLKGCTPLGTVDAGDRAWLVGDCHGKRRAVPVPLMDEKVEVESIDHPTISCTAQRLELRQGRFALRLREPRAGLEAVLPAGFVPTGARAGWSGSTLLTVFKVGPRLETRAYGCRDGKLEPLP
jgi:hypothetical protein